MRQHWEATSSSSTGPSTTRRFGCLRNKTGATRLGFAVLVKFFEFEVASQAEPRGSRRGGRHLAGRWVSLELFRRYGWTGRTKSASSGADQEAFRISGVETEADAETLTAGGRRDLATGPPTGAGGNGAARTLPGRAGGAAVAWGNHPDLNRRLAAATNGSRGDACGGCPAGDPGRLGKAARSARSRRREPLGAGIPQVRRRHVGLESMLAELDKWLGSGNLDLAAGSSTRVGPKWCADGGTGPRPRRRRRMNAHPNGSGSRSWPPCVWSRSGK